MTSQNILVRKWPVVKERWNGALISWYERGCTPLSRTLKEAAFLFFPNNRKVKQRRSEWGVLTNNSYSAFFSTAVLCCVTILNLLNPCSHLRAALRVDACDLRGSTTDCNAITQHRSWCLPSLNHVQMTTRCLNQYYTHQRGWASALLWYGNHMSSSLICVDIFFFFFSVFFPAKAAFHIFTFQMDTGKHNFMMCDLVKDKTERKRSTLIGPRMDLSTSIVIYFLCWCKRLKGNWRSEAMSEVWIAFIIWAHSRIILYSCLVWFE